jgi:hypothetical protein
MIGSSVGNTYLFSNQNPASAGTQPQAQAQGTPQGSGYDDFMGKQLEDLENVEGMTQDYYTKWINLKSYAKTMWNEMGIDVTSPDLENEDSIRANKIYMKAVADVRNQGNRLKEGKNVEDKMEELQAQGEQLMRINDAPGRETRYSDFTNTSLTDGDEAIIKRVDVNVNTTQERDILLKHKNDYVRTLQNELASESDPRKVLALTTRISALTEIEPVYDATEDRDRAERKRAAEAKGGDENAVANFQFLWRQLQDGRNSQDVTALRAFSTFDPRISGARYWTDPTDGVPYIVYEYNLRSGEAETKKINLNDNVNGLRAAAELAGNSNEYKDLNQNKLITTYNGGVASNQTLDKQTMDSLNEYLEKDLSGETKDKKSGFVDAQDKFNAPNMKMPPLHKQSGNKVTTLAYGGENIEGIHIYNANNWNKKGPYFLVKFIDENGGKQEVEYKVDSEEGKDLRRKIISTNAGSLANKNKIGTVAKNASIEDIAVDLGTDNATIKVGHKEDGYIFKGGDPSDPNNWVKEK